MTNESLVPSLTKKELCVRFGCTYKTLTLWLKGIPDLDYNHIKNMKLIPPKYTKIILNHLE